MGFIRDTALAWVYFRTPFTLMTGFFRPTDPHKMDGFRSCPKMGDANVVS